MKVVLDSNIYIHDFKMRSMDFNILFKYSKIVPFEIFMPRVIYDEILNKYKETIEKTLTDYNKEKYKLNQLLISYEVGTVNINIDVILQDYREYLDDVIEKNKIKILEYPKVSHSTIVNAILKRERPFKNNESGYRDKLILETLKESFKIPNETIVFISNNSRDFGKEPYFFDDIENQLSNTTYWKLHNSLSSFISKYLQTVMVKKDIIITDESKMKIEQFIYSKEFVDAIDFYEIGNAVLELDYGYGKVYLEKIDKIENIEISEYEKFDSIESFSIMLVGTFVFYVSGDSSDFSESESWCDFFNYDLAEGDCNISMSINEKSTLFFNVTFEKDKVANIEFEQW